MAQVMPFHVADFWPEDPMLPFQWPTQTPVREAAEEQASPFAPIEEVVAAFARGELVLVVDDEDRENEGDLIMAAQFATSAKVAFMVRHTSGVLCVPMSGERLDALDLPLMVAQNTESMRTAYTITVDAKGVGTGISAEDRALTVRTLANPTSVPSDLHRPGHIFPLRAREGGVLKRAGHTEAGVDLAKLAGLEPVALLAEVVNDDGTMARLPQLRRFAHKHGLLITSIADLIEYRRHREKLVTSVATTRMPTSHGDFVAHVYESLPDGEEHIALVRGVIDPDVPVLVRVHSECLTGDVFGSRRCDCGQQLDAALERIADEGVGVVLYLRGHEGRGIGLAHKLQAYALQEQGLDTVEANLALGLPVDTRNYGVGAQILADLGVRQMRLMTNNPAKYAGLDGYGLEIVERVPLVMPPDPENLRYLQVKQQKLGHLLDLAGD
ncbi:MAG: bifunctional 3,4-dihydroxy-2-butanone-4-phosphate synthase/GTP cyclohydrolase II [Chloroflexota bacterium]